MTDKVDTKGKNFLKVKSNQLIWAIPMETVLSVQAECFETAIGVHNPWMRGVLFYNNEVIPMIDILGLLQNEITDVKAYIICRFGSSMVAFVVSEVAEMVSTAQLEILCDERQNEEWMLTAEEQGKKLLLLQKNILERLKE